MAGEVDTAYLETAAVFLGAAVLAVPVAKRLGLGSIIGYLAAGAAIGPQGAALVADPDTAIGVAEFGVVLLLFVIGLELRPARLWRLRAEIFGLGLLQVVCTAAMLFPGLVYFFGFTWPPAVLLALALALSSTAFAVQMLRERGDLTQPYGNRAFSILLFQDLAIVPLLALPPILAAGSLSGEMEWSEAFIALGAIAGLGLGVRYGLRPLFMAVARTGSDEIFTSAALLVVVGSALVMEFAGLSMALGAFIAGVLLAESEFRHQLESDIEPFRGLLLGLFFMGVGMGVNWQVVSDNAAAVVLGALGLYLIKMLALYALTGATGSNHRDSLRIAASLGQGGEFGFVLFGAATSVVLILPDEASLFSAIVTASMILTPFMMRFADRLARERDSDEGGEVEGAEAAPKANVIVAGFGRVGQVVARVLRLRGYSVTLIDNSPKRIRMAATFGNKVYYGDARRVDVLKSAGADGADIIFLCIDDRGGAREAVVKVRDRFPNTLIFADTYDRFSEWELRDAGADEVVRETFESAIQLARLGLQSLGDSDVAEELIEEFRRRDAELVRMQSEYGARGGLEKLREKYSLEAPG